jgi:hypothetical protein
VLEIVQDVGIAREGQAFSAVVTCTDRFHHLRGGIRGYGYSQLRFQSACVLYAPRFARLQTKVSLIFKTTYIYTRIKLRSKKSLINIPIATTEPVLIACAASFFRCAEGHHE